MAGHRIPLHEQQSGIGRYSAYPLSSERIPWRDKPSECFSSNFVRAVADWNPRGTRRSA